MKNYKHLLRLFLLTSLIFTCISCKKSKKGEINPDEISTPLKTEQGAVIGSATKVKIGVNGGSIAMPDNYISINVPAGAVDTETEFSIQEVQTNAAISTGRLFRILPEGITLKKPVEITFKYTDADIAGANEDFLYPCYQSNDGYWRTVKNSVLDKTNKTLKVSTTHFSDWGIIRDVILYASKYELGANEVIDLEAFVYDLSENDLVKSSGSKLKPEQIVEWKVVNGGGTITGGNNPNVKYKAPNTSGKIEVIVEVTVKNVISKISTKDDVIRPGTGGLVIVRKTLTILPEEYVTWTIAGTKYTADFYSISVLNGQTILSGVTSTGTLSVGVRATGTGSYSVGNLSEAGKSFSIATYDNKNFGNSYYDCGTRKTEYGGGAVVFELFGQKNEIIQGHFSSDVYFTTDCNKETKKLVGSFRVKRGQ